MHLWMFVSKGYGYIIMWDSPTGEYYYRVGFGKQE